MSNRQYEIVAEVFDRRQRLIARATNSYHKTHPLQKYFAEKVGQPHREFLHAEIAALLKCKDKKPYSIKVWRKGPRGELRCSKPCPICMEAIKAWGIVEIWHS